MAGRFYSAKALASFGVRGLPRSERRMHDVARRENWPSREVPAQGGKHGTRVEYEPPPLIQREIDELVADPTSNVRLHYNVSETPNPDGAYAAMSKLRDATRCLTELQAELQYELPLPLRDTLQQLLFSGELSPAGARQLIEMLSHQAADEQTPAPGGLGDELVGDASLTWPLTDRRKRQAK